MGRHLAIDVSEFGASFVVLSSAGSLQKLSVEFNSVKIDEIKQVLDGAFEQSILQGEFNEMTIAWSTLKSTLVPNAIFAESTPKAIFKLCFGSDSSGGDVDYNRIAELSVVNVFQIPLWLKSYFVIKFPRVIIQSAGTHILRQVMDSNAFKLKATIIVYDRYFQLIIVKHTKLEFYSFFDAQSAEDVIYHLMFVLQQKELSSEEGNVELIPGVGCSSQILDEIITGISKVNDLSQFNVLRVDDFIAKAQQLCV